MIGQELCDGCLVEAKANLGFFAKQAEARHGSLDRLHVYAPQIHEEDNLELELRVLRHGNVAAHVGVVLVVEQEHVAQEEDLAQPLEHVRVVVDLMLY